MSNLMIPVTDMKYMAEAFAKSKLFGVKNPEEAMALMLIAQAENLHPAAAIRDYHIIQGKPALKADAMLARFQSAGGSVKWKELSDKIVKAEFSHPSGGTAEISWTMEDAKRAGFASKDNWQKFPRQMLRARVVSEGIRTVFPGVVVGAYTPEEVQDFDDKPTVQQTEEAAPVIDDPFYTSEGRKDWLKKQEESLKVLTDEDGLKNWLQQNNARVSELGDNQRGWLNEKIAEAQERLSAKAEKSEIEKKLEHADILAAG